MRNKETFVEWLKTHTSLIDYTIGRYSGAIETITAEVESYGLAETNLYLANEEFIRTILANPAFKQKNNKGNRMYSSALNKLIEYLEFYNDQEFQEELLKEELEYDSKVSTNVAEGNVTTNIVDEEKEKPSYSTVNNKKVWKRNAKYASNAIANAEYKCEIDPNHQHFISKYSNENYVEAHHIIPMFKQDRYDCSLDVYANIVSLCMVCHKKLHYGHFEDKKEILDTLFKDRVGRLSKSGIQIKIDTLYEIYKD